MNKKVTGMLSALAVVLVDERPDLIKKVHDVINDKRDGYPYNFKDRLKVSALSSAGIRTRESFNSCLLGACRVVPGWEGLDKN